MGVMSTSLPCVWGPTPKRPPCGARRLALLGRSFFPYRPSKHILERRDAGAQVAHLDARAHRDLAQAALVVSRSGSLARNEDAHDVLVGFVALEAAGLERGDVRRGVAFHAHFIDPAGRPLQGVDRTARRDAALVEH